MGPNFHYKSLNSIISGPRRFLSDLGRQHFPAGPINNGNKVDKPSGHGNIVCVHRPVLVGSVDGQPPQQIGIHLMARVLLDGSGFSVQGASMPMPFISVPTCLRPTANSKAASIELILRHPSTHERMHQMQLINAAHQRQISGIHRFWPIIDATAAYANQLSLPFDRKSMLAVDYRFAFSNPTLLSAPSKKNRFPASVDQS